MPAARRGCPGPRASPRSTTRPWRRGTPGASRPGTSPAGRGRCRPWPSPARRRRRRRANGPGGAEAADRAVHERGVQRGEGVVADPGRVGTARVPWTRRRRRRRARAGGARPGRTPCADPTRCCACRVAAAGTTGSSQPGSSSTGSTRITSAPKSARTIVAIGPARPWLRSRTRRPAHAPGIVVTPPSSSGTPTSRRPARRTAACRDRPRSAT